MTTRSLESLLGLDRKLSDKSKKQIAEVYSSDRPEDNFGLEGYAISELEKRYLKKLELARQYETAVNLTNNSCLRKILLEKAACCYDIAGIIANSILQREKDDEPKEKYNRMKFEARIKAAQSFDRIDYKYASAWSYARAAEAMFNLGDKKRAIFLLREALKRHCSMKIYPSLEAKRKQHNSLAELADLLDLNLNLEYEQKRI